MALSVPAERVPELLLHTVEACDRSDFAVAAGRIRGGHELSILKRRHAIGARYPTLGFLRRLLCLFVTVGTHASRPWLTGRPAAIPSTAAADIATVAAATRVARFACAAAAPWCG
jgi:hypothetical protein